MDSIPRLQPVQIAKIIETFENFLESRHMSRAVKYGYTLEELIALPKYNLPMAELSNIGVICAAALSDGYVSRISDEKADAERDRNVVLYWARRSPERKHADLVMPWEVSNLTPAQRAAM